MRASGVTVFRFCCTYAELSWRAFLRVPKIVYSDNQVIPVYNAAIIIMKY